MISFGVGKLTVTPEVGDEAQIGIVQDVTIDFSFSKKELYGEMQFPVDVARGQGKINIKAKAAKIDAKVFNAVFFNGLINEASGKTTITVNNQLMGDAPWFALKLEVQYQGKKLSLSFPRCCSSKLGLGFKNEDYTIPDFDIDATADEGGKLYTLEVAA
jgi:hypothetical protein